MARISDLELERLKKQISLERLVLAKGVGLQRRGELLVGKCPLHEDAGAALEVTAKSNNWRCTGCKAGGSVVDWVMRTEGVGFVHAVELLKNEVPLSAGVVKQTRVRLPLPFDASADDATLFKSVAEYYHRRLSETETPREYLKKHGLDAQEVMTHFRLGYADKSLGYFLPHSETKTGGALRGRLMALGLYRESGQEHLAGSLVVPLLDAQGAVRGLYGHKVTPRLRAGTALELYVPESAPCLFNEGGLAGQARAVLCATPLDALTFWAAGFRHVTCSWGKDGFTTAHLEALKKLGVKDCLVAFARDDVGDAAAELLAVRLIGQGFNAWRVQFPRGLGANGYALKVQPAAKSLEVALRQAEWMGGDKAAKSAPRVVAAPSSPTGPSAVPTAPPPSAAVPVGPRGEEVQVKVAEVEISAVPVPAAPAAAASPPAPPQAALAGAVEAPEVEQRTDEGADELHFRFGPRSYRVRGLSKNESADALKVNVLLSTGDGFHVDSFDLYQAKARAHFVAAAAAEARVAPDAVKRDMGQVLLRLEELQDEARKKAAAPKTPTLTEAEATAALELLRTPNLLERVLADFARCGVVGEETNKLVAFLATVSRKLEEPLAVLIQSSSAAGKSSLMEAVLAFVPEEDRVKYSAMTGQSLFYMGDVSLKHKVLAVVEEEGASRAAYALKLLQSEGELTIASTGKNPTSGRLETHEYHVEGPTQLMLTTTASELDEELLNRCLVLTVDEERGQTQSIHRLQREKQTLQGLLARREREAVLALHQNAQRMLRPLLVANPFAPQLTFLDDRTRTRRDFPKYLTLIRAIALLHQHQRPVKTVQHGDAVLEYIEVTLDDVAVANRLAAQVLGRSLDELPPQTRRLLHQLEAWVSTECTRLSVQRAQFRFTRRQLREVVAMSNAQVALHLSRLVDFEHLVAHRAGKGGGFEYELSYDGGGRDGAPVLPGLVDVEALASNTTAAPKLPGVKAKFPDSAAKFPAPFRPVSGPLPESRNGQKPNGLHVLSLDGRAEGKTAHSGVSKSGASSVGEA